MKNNKIKNKEKFLCINAVGKCIHNKLEYGICEITSKKQCEYYS